MKFNIEADMTPEELRRTLGLPDLTEVHEAYLGQIKSTMTKGITPDAVEQMMKTWMPMGVAGVDVIKDLLGGLASGGKAKKG